MRGEKESEVSTIFLNLQKAFDTLDPGILLKKLEAYGLSKICVKRFEKYLSSRFQYVDLNKVSKKD